jgi:hypothetical protein
MGTVPVCLQSERVQLILFQDEYAFEVQQERGYTWDENEEVSLFFLFCTTLEGHLPGCAHSAPWSTLMKMTVHISPQNGLFTRSYNEDCR